MMNGNGSKSDHSSSAEATPVEKSPEPQPQHQPQRQQPVVPMPNAAAPPMFPPPPTMTFVPPTTQQPSINFLQESQIGTFSFFENARLKKQDFYLEPEKLWRYFSFELVILQWNWSIGRFARVKI